MTDTERLDFLLRNAHLTCTDDGENLCLFFTEKDDELSFVIVAYATGESSEEPFTAEDVPFLSDAQRANLNGATTTATGYVDDPAAIRSALDFAARV